MGQAYLGHMVGMGCSFNFSFHFILNLYGAYWTRIEDHTKSAKAAAILTLIGAINIPIIKFSVDWWNTLHQPASIIRVDGPTIHSSMLVPLILMAISFMSFYFSFVLLNTQTELYKRRLKAIFVKSLIEGKK